MAPVPQAQWQGLPTHELQAPTTPSVWALPSWLLLARLRPPDKLRRTQKARKYCRNELWAAGLKETVCARCCCRTACRDHHQGSSNTASLLHVNIVWVRCHGCNDSIQRMNQGVFWHSAMKDQSLHYFRLLAGLLVLNKYYVDVTTIRNK